MYLALKDTVAQIHLAFHEAVTGQSEGDCYSL